MNKDLRITDIIGTIKKNNSYSNDINKERLNELLKVFCDLDVNCSVVLYGIGKIGKDIFTILRFLFKDRIVAICDNNFKEKKYDGIPVYTHEQCVKKFSDSFYVISVQNGYFEIALRLKLDGIKSYNIGFYDNMRKKLIEANVPRIKNSHVFNSLANDREIVLYGIGKTGKKIFDELNKYQDIKVVAVCDNNFECQYYENIPVYKHDECVKKFVNIKYLISVQKGYIGIISNLLSSGIEKENIVFFNNQKNRLEF